MSRPIILPKIANPDFSFPGRKPIGPVEIDWENPITEGLYDIWLLGSAYPDRGLVRGNPYTIHGSGTKIAPDSIITAESGQYITLGKLPIPSWTAVSLFVIYKEITGGGNFFRLMSVNKNTSDDIRLMPVNPVSSPTDLRADWDDGTFIAQSFSVANNNEINTLGITHTGSTAATYANGRQKNTDADDLDTTGFSGEFRLGTGGAVSQQVYATYIGAIAFSRALTKAEAESLTADPYQLLKPQNDPVYFVPATSGVSGTALVSSATGTTTTGSKQGSGTSSVSSATAATSQGSKDVSGTASESSITGTTESGRKEASSSASVSAVTNASSTGTSGLSGSASATSATGSTATATKSASSDVSVSSVSSTSATGTVVETRSGTASVSASSNSISSGSKSSTGDSLVSSSSDTTTVSTTNRVGISSVSVSSSVAFQAFKAITDGLFVSSTTNVSASGIKQITGESTSNITSKQIVTIVDDSVIAISVNDEAIIVNV